MVKAPISLYIYVLLTLTVGALGQKETYQFFLDITDKMDPDWVSTTHEGVRSKIQCASLCFRLNQTNCDSFGYMNHTCHILKMSIDKESCSQDDCSESGMKIYKRKGGEEKSEWSCEKPDGEEVEVKCKDNNNLLKCMGSRSPLFGDVLIPYCTDMEKQVFGEKEETKTFFAEDDGISIQAACPDPKQIIVKLKLCVMKTRIPAMTLHCRYLKNPDDVENQFKVTNEEIPSTIDCKDGAAITRIKFGPWPDNDAQTFVEFGCSKLPYKSKTNTDDKKLL